MKRFVMDMKLKQMLFTIRAMMDKTPEGEPLNLRISEIPDDFLSCWIVPDAGKYKPYFLEQKPIDELMNDIPLQVFIYAYGGRRYGKPSADLRDGKTVWLHFLQYLKLLYNASYARSNGIAIRDFRIFDFDRYPELLSRLQAELSVP